MSNTKLLAVFGATGNQGGSVIQNVLQDPELSSRYRIRAITRSSKSANAQRLTKDVEVVEADMQDRPSLERALTGVDYVFLITISTFASDGLHIEREHAKLVADVAVEKGVEYLIFSTLPWVRQISNGKYTHAEHFDAKAEAEQYIRKLNVKSSFISIAGFMQNFEKLPLFKPRKDSDGTWYLSFPNTPDIRIPFIDAIEDTGKFVAAILASPEELQGKILAAAAGLYSYTEVCQIMTKLSGRKVGYKQVDVAQFKAGLPFAAEAFSDSMTFAAEIGYYGRQTEMLVDWSLKQLSGEITSLEEYLKRHGIHFSE